MARLKDIAEKAGVSISTVSRVLKHDKNFSISLKNRQQILQIAQELQYPVSEAPRVIEQNSIEGNIGLILLYNEMDEIEDPYYLSIRSNFKAEALRLGLAVSEYFHSNPDEDLLLGKHTLLVFIGSGSFWTPKLHKQVKKSEKPLILVDFFVPDLEADFVLTNFEELTEKAVSHLLNAGFSKVGFIGSRDLNVTSHSYMEDEREIYFTKILKEKQLFEEKFIHLSTHTSLEDGYNLARKAIEESNVPEAYFVETDTMAIGVIKALQESGLSVPGDVAIVSCNDIPQAQYLHPALTTMGIHTELMGTMAARFALEKASYTRMQGLKLYVPNELIVRQSCGQKKAE